MTLGFATIKVQHVEEVLFVISIYASWNDTETYDSEQCTDDLTNGVGSPQICVRHNGSNRLRQPYDTFAENDQCQQAHALDKMCAFEADDAKNASYDSGNNRFADCDDVERDVRVRLLAFFQVRWKSWDDGRV